MYPSMFPSFPNCRLAELVTLVSDGLQLECSPELDRVQFGEKLKLAIGKFTVDFIPHMNEEEEVRSWSVMTEGTMSQQ